MRWAVVVAAFFAGLGWCQAPPPNYIVKLSPTIFQVSLPATAAAPASHCLMWVRLGGFYDAEIACYVGSVYTGRLETAPAGTGYDGGFHAPGGGFIRWAVCNPAADEVVGCGKGTAPPAGLTNPMYFQLTAQLGDGSPPQTLTGFY